MRKNQFLLAISLFLFAGCDGFDSFISKSLDIKLETGKSYRFNENSITVTKKPNDFVVEVINNEIEGIHEGKTKMVVKAGDITYNCNVEVTAAHTLYVDMSKYIGFPKSAILSLYGDPIKVSGDAYLFGPFVAFSPEQKNIFTFDANGKVLSSMIFFSMKDAEAVVYHLKDRYAIFGTENYKTIMGDANKIEDCNIVVLFDYSKDPVYAFYTTKAELDKVGKSTELILDENVNRLKSMLLQK